MIWSADLRIQRNGLFEQNLMRSNREVIRMSEEIVNVMIPVSEWPELDRRGAIVSRMTAERPIIPIGPDEEPDAE